MGTSMVGDLDNGIILVDLKKIDCEKVYLKKLFQPQKPEIRESVSCKVIPHLYPLIDTLVKVDFEKKKTF